MLTLEICPVTALYWLKPAIAEYFSMSCSLREVTIVVNPLHHCPLPPVFDIVCKVLFIGQHRESLDPKFDQTTEVVPLHLAWARLGPCLILSQIVGGIFCVHVRLLLLKTAQRRHKSGDIKVAI